MSIGLQLGIAFLLVLLNGFFVAAEFALVRVRSTRLTELANEGKGAARMALQAIRHFDVYLSAAQLGITLASLALGSIGEPAITRLLEPVFEGMHLAPSARHWVGWLISLSIVSLFHMVIGEQVPKMWAIQQSEKASLAAAYPLHAFYWLLRPGIWLINLLTQATLRLFRLNPTSEHEMAHSEEELRMILTASGQSGVLKDSEVDLVKHVFEFADKVARDIMVPRVDMVYLDAAWPLERNLQVAQAHTFTRFPLCERGPDHVIGMIHIKDLLRLTAAGGQEIREARREIMFVPETKSIDQLLREFQVRKMHMASVVDEYGGTAGIVTLEDVLETYWSRSSGRSTTSSRSRGPRSSRPTLTSSWSTVRSSSRTSKPTTRSPCPRMAPRPSGAGSWTASALSPTSVPSSRRTATRSRSARWTASECAKCC
jgi:CBS domain containing-hemolysin-like protein